MRLRYLSLIGLGATLLFSACSKWTEPQIEDINKPLAQADKALAQSYERYLENLRAYKNSDHEVSFGWFGGWTADGPKSRFLYHLPDSMDFVTIWGGWQNLNEAKREDLKRAQQEKGLKVLTCALLFEIGKEIVPGLTAEDQERGLKTYQDKVKEMLGFDKYDPTTYDVGTDNYTDALLDTIFKYDYDGFDLDAEPSYAQPFATDYEVWRKTDSEGKTLAERIMRRMAKRIGPTAETEEGRKKMLVVDGEPDFFPPDMIHSFNYIILQAYGSSGPSSLDYRFDKQVNHFKSVLSPAEIAKKIIITEEFEKYSANWGVRFTSASGQVFTSSYLGMADYQPRYGRKGGIGSYHTEMNYATTPVYKQVREGIAMMNPPVK